MLHNPSALLMVRPRAFGFNRETASSNAFQRPGSESSETILGHAQEEFDTLVEQLRAHHIEAWVADDTDTPEKPDALFPNNWVSFHEDGRVILYPLQPVNRRAERRLDIIEWFRSTYLIREVVDESPFELQGKFLEGTGSLVFDYVNKLAYACRSPRTSEELVHRICSLLGYKAIVFDAVDEAGMAVYHTNVMLSVGTKVAVVCLDAIHSEADQDLVLGSFASTGHRVVAISYEQMRSFAGNVLEVNDTSGNPHTLMSQAAFDSLLPGQMDAISRFSEPFPIAIPTIERYGGGSVRCLVAGVHLPKRT